MTDKEPKINPKKVIKTEPEMRRECIGCEVVPLIPIGIIILIILTEIFK
jgi:hypothetical protein